MFEVSLGNSLTRSNHPIKSMERSTNDVLSLSVRLSLSLPSDRRNVVRTLQPVLRVLHRVGQNGVLDRAVHFRVMRPGQLWFKGGNIGWQFRLAWMFS